MLNIEIGCWNDVGMINTTPTTNNNIHWKFGGILNAMTTSLIDTFIVRDPWQSVVNIYKHLYSDDVSS